MSNTNILAVLQQQLRQKSIDEQQTACIWTYDDFYDLWDTSCDLSWQLFDGTPEDHHIHYCPRCGKPAIFKKEEEE